MKPGVLDSNWSTDTTAPGALTDGISMPDGGALVRHGFLVAFAYRHAVHLGGVTFHKRLGMMPTSAASLSLEKGHVT